MKLEFLWFEEYKNLKNFQANMGSPYIYKYDEPDKFFINFDNNYINNYFDTGKNNVNLSVSAIVGENGVGKSTILDFISDYIKNTLAETKYLLVFKLGEKRVITQNISNDTAFLKINFGKQVKIKIDAINDIAELPHTMLFSNVFDVRYLKNFDDAEEDISFFTDISTNHLLWESENNIVEFLNKEFEKQIYFIYDFMNDLDVMGIIKTPEYIKVSLIEDMINPNSDFEALFEEIVINFDSKVGKAYFNRNESDEFKILTLNMILKNYLYIIELELQQHFIKHRWMVPSIADIYNQFSFDSLKRAMKIFGSKSKYNENNIFEYLPLVVQMHLLEFSKFEEKDIMEVTKKIKQISKAMNNFTSEILKLNFVKLKGKQKNTDHLSGGNFRYIKSSENIINFIRLHKNLFINNQLFNFSWTEMSSGEYGILNLFGRIYNTLREIDKEDSSCYLLLIDEGDLYFHPQWQKDWLFYFIQFIVHAFNKDVQIILTTHSPLVLSDFPNSNVLFLGGGIYNGYQLEGSPRTLGANILELFSNSFFLNGGLVGRYGKNQINKNTRELVTLPSNKIYANRERYETFIDNIGEPLVRSNLTEIYKGKLSLYTDNEIVERIKTMELEIEKLKKLRMNND